MEEALLIWKDSVADFADCLIAAQNPKARMSSDGNFRYEGCQVARISRCLTTATL
ncbi:MAG: hypothetical protein ABI619_03845 [Betaproteobacteria bacterium]